MNVLSLIPSIVKFKSIRLKRKDLKSLFKSVLSYFIAITIIFTLSRAHLDDWDEHGSYFSKLQANNYLIQLPISVLLNDPSRSVGAMIQASSIYFLVILSTGLIAYFAAPAILHSPFLVLFFFFVALFLINLLKASYPKLLTSTMNSAMLIIISAVISAYYDKVTGVYHVGSIASQIEIFVLGGLISCAVNFLVFPRWAGDDLRKAMKTGIRAQGKLLAVLSRIVATLRQGNYLQVVPESEKSAILTDLQAAIKESRSTFKEIAALLADSRLEISYSPFDRSYYEAFTVIIRRLLRHLAAIGSSCESLMNINTSDDQQQQQQDLKSMSSFGQFMLDIHDDLILFTNVSMMELRFIYNKFQSRQKHQSKFNWDEEEDEDNDDDGENGGGNPWDQVSLMKRPHNNDYDNNLQNHHHHHHSAFSSPWGSPLGGLASTSSPDKEPILPTASAGTGMDDGKKGKRKVSSIKKAIKAVFTFGAKRGLAFRRKNAQKIESLFPHSYTNEFDGNNIPAGSHQDDAVSGNADDAIIPLVAMKETAVNPLPRIPETESRIRSYSSTNAAAMKRNPDLRHSKTYSFTNSYISHTISNRPVSENFEVASVRASTTNQSEPIRSSVKSKSPTTMSAYPGWRLSDAIECIKQHQKEVIHAFISESRIMNGDGANSQVSAAVDVSDRNRQSNLYFDNDNDNDNDKATISNVLRFFPSLSPRLGREPKISHDDSNLLDNMDDLYAIFSFLLCLSNYGDKLDQLGRRSRQMPTFKKLYIPFVWNYPEFGLNSSQCRLQRDESSKYHPL